MNLKHYPLVVLLLLHSGLSASAQDNGGYKTPPKAIADMLLATPTPGVSVDDNGEWILFTESSSYPSVEELARPELKIAGLRINPRNFAPSRQNYSTNLILRNIASGKDLKIAGLPSPLYAGNISWSPDDKKIAFTQVTTGRVDLYMIDVATQIASKINKTALNIITGAYQWYDNKTELLHDRVGGRRFIERAVAEVDREIELHGVAHLLLHVGVQWIGADFDKQGIARLALRTDRRGQHGQAQRIAALSADGEGRDGQGARAFRFEAHRPDRLRTGRAIAHADLPARLRAE